MNIPEVFGVVGGVLSILLFFPQIIKALKTKKTNDLAAGTYWMIIFYDSLWAIYSIFDLNSIIVTLSTIGSIICSSFVLFLKKSYDHNG